MTTDLTVINNRPQFTARSTRPALRAVDARARFSVSLNGVKLLSPISRPTALRVIAPARVSFAPQGGTRVLVARPERGPQGEPGDAVQSAVCAQTVSALRVVAIVSGQAFLADHANSTHAGRVAGLTLTAANVGGTTSIRTFGRVTDASWNWTVPLLFVGTGGGLVGSPPLTGFCQPVARVESANTIFIIPLSLIERA